jgi:osmoprotectant transport system permease protein
VDLLTFWSAHRIELAVMLRQHMMLVLVATLIAASVGIPLGVLAARRPTLGRVLSAITNIAQTIPSLALFGFLLPLPLVGGVGARTALVALSLYGLLPIVRTTMTGLAGIDRGLIEAADAIGLTGRQRLRLIELPLALPSILAGVRVAAVIGVGTATIAAAIGAGGLGDYIFRGLAMVDSTVILAGAVPAALLALAVDAALAWLEHRSRRRARWRPRALAAAVGAVAAALLLVLAPTSASRDRTIVVGSKSFTEQLILGELVATALERWTDLHVRRTLNLGGTLICERALATGDIDVYVEYSGTALTAIFKEPVVHDRTRALSVVRQRYAATGRTLGAPLGFNNTFAILVRGETASRHNLVTISDAVPFARQWRAGFGYEFLEREDGLRGLAATYGLQFSSPPRVMDLTLSYRALASGEVDLIAGDATSGLIDALRLTVLEDDRRYFPPYDAVPVVRTATLLRYPEIRVALDRLGGHVTEKAMRALNRAVDVDRRDPQVVAREFLDRIAAAGPGQT